MPLYLLLSLSIMSVISFPSTLVLVSVVYFRLLLNFPGMHIPWFIYLLSYSWTFGLFLVLDLKIKLLRMFSYMAEASWVVINRS